MWIAPIHDTAFVQRAIKSIEGQEKDYGTWPRVHGMLSLAANVSSSPHLLLRRLTSLGTRESILHDRKQDVWHMSLFISAHD